MLLLVGNISVEITATSFGHNGHHQAISQKLKKKAGTYGAKSSIYMGSHLHLH